MFGALKKLPVQFSEATLSQRLVACALLALGLLYPFGGFVAFAIGHWRGASQPVQLFPFIGAALALTFFVVEYVVVGPQALLL